MDPVSATPLQRRAIALLFAATCSTQVKAATQALDWWETLLPKGAEQRLEVGIWQVLQRVQVERKGLQPGHQVVLSTNVDACSSDMLVASSRVGGSRFRHMTVFLGRLAWEQFLSLSALRGRGGWCFGVGCR